MFSILSFRLLTIFQEACITATSRSFKHARNATRIALHSPPLALLILLSHSRPRFMLHSGNLWSAKTVSSFLSLGEDTAIFARTWHDFKGLSGELLRNQVSMGYTTDVQKERSKESEASNVVTELLKQAGGCVAIDGGLATQLERHGADINDPLWSALCLITRPDLIRTVHEEYLQAGATIIATASYQATIQGFQSRGLPTEEAEDLLQKSVRVAREERDKFWKEFQNKVLAGTARAGSRQRALVAASIGSYGAYLADGSEYSGDYGPSMTLEKLKDFHRRRLVVLADAGPDLVALETIPCKLETQALVELLNEENLKVPAWISFNSKDGVNVVKGDSLADCVSLVDKCAKVVAVGINCTPPRFILDLICAAREVTNKPIMVYPNSGEHYDPVIKQWVESTGITDTDFVSYVHEWRKAGAQLIGGCCRTTPDTIGAISRALHEDTHVHVT